MKSIVKFFLTNKALSWLILILILAGGVFAYQSMGKLEDAPFTIKQALVTTAYPGASPMEVQQQVTDVLEEAIQSLGELYYLKTENRAGLSKITVYVKKEIRAKDMQQLWDKLRRKVNDVQDKLPAGAGPSVVNDDFGDVLGVFYGLSSETHTYRELEDYAREIKNELLNVKDVAKVELFGIPNRTIEVKVNPTLLSQSGVMMSDITSAFDKQNRIVDAGAIETSTNRLRIESEGCFASLDEIKNLTVVSHKGEYFRLGEIAEVSEDYAHPSRSLMRIDNVPAVGIAISTVSDGNVVEMAELVSSKIKRLKATMPEGYNLNIIYDQGHESAVANDGFIMNLIVSVLTVVGVLLFFIGLKNGFLIGSGLIFSIFGTLVYMQATGIALQRMSLAAIIIAMGMLVDNAIVVYDAALVNMQRGMRKRIAILNAVSGTDASSRCDTDSRTYLPAGIPFPAYHRRDPVFSVYCDCRIVIAQLGTGCHTECFFRTRVRTPSSSGRAEERIVQWTDIRLFQKGTGIYHTQTVPDRKLYGRTARLSRLGIQVHSTAIHAAAQQAVLHH